MNKLKLFTIALLLTTGGFILITACNKADDPASIIGSWKVTGAVFNPAYDPGSGLATDAYSLMFSQACSQDDLIIFQDNCTVINDEGALKCDSLSPQQSTDNYTLSGTNLTLISTTDTTTLTNVSIGTSTMSGTLSINFGGVAPANVDMTLTRQ